MCSQDIGGVKRLSEVMINVYKEMFGDKRLSHIVLDLADSYASQKSGCAKVSVGSVIVTTTGRMVHGANTTLPFSCRDAGCRRVDLYGDDSKNHRLPEDCRAVHSEIDAITRCARQGIPTEGATIYITRYPCEACARAIVQAGIKNVVWGRQQDISPETALIFKHGGVEYIWESDWVREDTTR